ncbi:hypothetical protein Dda_2773 [Drechslerella dactyloides]|uniref:Formylmethionine deformylase-like protein n=1 Tax=Drechslerella dactyloides TaxID=74499 RepID=A0AAD6J4I5_DREDA|nr:hypothetical protein Dda_2773 [Drechslerella dactyloides]
MSGQNLDTSTYGEDHIRVPWSQTPSYTSIPRRPLPDKIETAAATSVIDLQEQYPPRQSKWGITWQTPALAIVSYVSGLAVAVGNHVYFTRLNNTPYENVVWVGRWALVLALIVKTCFATCILLCYEQVVWMGFRHRSQGTSIRAIDALFGSTYQVVSLLYPAMWIENPVASIMIAIRWLLPLISIVAPTTLTVQVRESVGSSSCQVPFLNLSAAAPISSGFTSPSGEYLSDLVQSEYTRNEWFPTPLASKIGTLTGLLGQPVSYPSPCGTNCSYSVAFHSALWQCMDTDPHNATAPWEIANNTQAPWATSNEGHEVAYTSIYKYVSLESNETGKLWVGHLIYKNVTLPVNHTFWDSWDVETFYCDTYNASISLRQAFVNGEQQDPVVEDIVYGARIDPYYGSLYTSENNITTEDLVRYQVTNDVLAKLFLGTVNYEGRAGRDFPTDTSILNMPAFLKPNLVANGDRNEEIKDQIRPLAEQLSLNYTMSLLAYPGLGIRQMQTTDCTVTTFSNVWRYEQRYLIIAYVAGLVAALMSLICGAIALGRNGLVSEISFSQVVATTRNPELDKLLEGNCLGKSDLQPRSLYGVKLRLGELRDPDGKLSGSGAAHAGFGTPQNVSEVRRQGYYI